VKSKTGTVGKALAVLVVSGVLAWAQADGGSAKTPAPAVPGSVNYVEGAVLLNGNALSREAVGSTVVKPGEKLVTNDGYAEILLTPGAFLRVGHNSEIEVPTAGLAATQVNVERGSAMLEVNQLIKGTNLGVEMNGTEAQVEKQGLYSFDAGDQVIQTFDGKLKVARDGKTVSLGKHDELKLASDKPLKKHDFDADAAKTEPLYVWSKARSEDLANASERAASNAESYVAVSPGWYWDPYFGGYGFWPYRASIYSPFGWGFYSPLYFGYYVPRYYIPTWGYPVRYWHGGHVGGTATRVVPGRAVAGRPALPAVKPPHISAPRPGMPHWSPSARTSIPAPHAPAPIRPH
jgi:hypothetical protein